MVETNVTQLIQTNETNLMVETNVTQLIQNNETNLMVETNITKLRQAGENVTSGEPFIAFAVPRYVGFLVNQKT